MSHGLPTSRAILAALASVALLVPACGSDRAAGGPGSDGAGATERADGDERATTTTERRALTTTLLPTTTTPEPTTTTAPPPPPKTAVAPAFPPSPTPPRPIDVTTPLTIHTFGDSTAFTLGWGVTGAIAPTGLGRVTIDARTSTGLTRSDYFDWPTHLLPLLLAPPEVAVVSFGANDSQPLVRPDGSVVAFGAPGWSEEYARRVDGVMQLLVAAGTRVYWVGQPIARDPAYADRMRILNDVYRDVVGRYPGATYIDAWHWLSDDAGAYTDTLPGADGAPVPLRSEDGIHLSEAGGDFLGAIVANMVLADHGIAR